ncbi:glycoside hydrolase family 2 protein [Pedobacter sp.]|uniref:glycoside hydrolase family 2 protein n=1 Tax=Pedobacter sp. TaxID=1411316 RepID=UPI003C6475B6
MRITNATQSDSSSNIKKLFAIIMISYLLSLTLEAKEIIPLDGVWQFALGPQTKDDSFKSYPISSNISKNFSDVTIPHTWNDHPVERVNKGQGFYLSKGWYKKTFIGSKKWKDKRVFIRFEGVGMESAVKLNGKEVGKHEGAYSAFCFEITDLLKIEGENLLEVEVSNLKNDNVVPAAYDLQTRFGGIYRPVQIIVTEPTCISPIDFASSGVYLNQSNVSANQADLKIDVMLESLSGHSKVNVMTSIKNHEGKTVKKIEQKIDIKKGSSFVSLTTTISNPHLWNGRKDPYLYTVETTLSTTDGRVLDSGIETLGFRYVKFTPNDGLFLNGEYYDLYGVSRWQDWADEGFAVTQKQDSIDIELMKELNCTGIRFACYQQDDYMYNAMDKNGFLCLAEIPLTPPDVKSEAFHNSSRNQLKELIKQLYNHPSIILWNLLNEVRPSAENLQDLNDLAKELDPSRPTAIVFNDKIVTEEDAQWHAIPDIICSNKYPWWYNFYGDVYANAGVFNDRYQDIKKHLPNAIFGVTEFGAGGCVTQHDQHPIQPDPIKGRFYPEEYQSMVHEKQWDLLKGHNEYWCKLIWNMTDFTWSRVERGDMIGRNHKGLVTHDRKIKKDAFFFYKAQWNTDVPTLYLTSRRHTQRVDAITPVKVYSNSEMVELFVNGISMGKVSNPHNCTFNWANIKLKPGINKVTIRGEFKGKKVEDNCEWILE